MNKIDINNVIDKYLSDKETIGNLSKSTITNRRYELNRLLLFCNKKNIQKIDKISKNLIIAYLKALRINLSSKKTVLSILTSFLDYCTEEEFIVENYAFSKKPPKSTTRPSMLWTGIF